MKNIVVIGGGTGLHYLVRKLKEEQINLSAIITVADDGGSSGRIRDNYEIIPPGDIRNVLVAMSEDEPLMKELFNFRFDQGDLAGHSLGNLLITALTKLKNNNLIEAIENASQVLNTKGKVIPVSIDPLLLKAHDVEGNEIVGEDTIGKHDKQISEVYFDNAIANPDAIKAIMEADLVILGPGSLYTSILANLIIPGINDAITKSTARKVYICNIMTQYNETLGMTCQNHIDQINKHLGGKIIDELIFDNSQIEQSTLDLYLEEGQEKVELGDCSEYKVIEASIAKVQDGVIRHSSKEIANLIMELL